MGIYIIFLVVTFIFTICVPMPFLWILLIAEVIITIRAAKRKDKSQKIINEQQTEIEALKKRIEELEKLRNEGR